MHGGLRSLVVVGAVLCCFGASPRFQDPAPETRKVFADLLGRLDTATARADYDMLIALLSRANRDSIADAVKSDFGGDPNSLMRFLKLGRHPARFRRVTRLADEVIHGECHYFKVVRTGDYSYLDKAVEPEFENKPVELWVCMIEEEDGTHTVDLEYPIHDILYLQQ